MCDTETSETRVNAHNEDSRRSKWTIEDCRMREREREIGKEEGESERARTFPVREMLEPEWLTVGLWL